ncbi:phage terminase small subunit [Lysinibacillus boronitolerans]|uniref:phage terminase small subunit n=1 Tax=Lysinibacillus boronitolerans TaxID=309788 RepID=UPI0021627183|nr:phage terminase small subunit [Lysinibacillus boronitolerans]MCS1393583.1 phage terminase small subunit [Lysinibacillus boronitolerans]
MARARDPNRDKAFEIYKEHNGDIPLKDIAVQLGKGEGTVRGWKNKDKWDETLNGTLQSNERNVPNKVGAPKGNDNAKGNRGNPNPTPKFPKRNSIAEKHGFFSKFLPEETLEIMEAMNERSPADLIWDQIQIQYAAIIRAQKIMHVESKDEMIKELKKEKMQGGKNPSQEVEYEFQFAWERQAQLLTAQSRAISELRTSINHFIKLADEADERRLKLEQMQLAIDKTRVEIDKLGSDEQNGPIEIKIVGKKRE